MPQPEFLNVPPEEAIRHFRDKGFHVGFDWRDTLASWHLASFTVAKVARIDLLEDIRDAVDAALADGTTFDEFTRRLVPTLQDKGWWGRQPMRDPRTGEVRVVQLGSMRRLRIIFDTNLRMATAHGQWQRIERLRERLPYLRYVSVRDARTRPEHAAWHGTVLPVDHPWWRTHFPPNGWRCRCTVVQLAADEVERHGGLSPEPDTRTEPWVNQRTGGVQQVPDGIDPGFAHKRRPARSRRRGPPPPPAPGSRGGRRRRPASARRARAVLGPGLTPVPLHPTTSVLIPLPGGQTAV